MPEPTETFTEKVVLLIIDKVAIGALIGLAAFCANLLLERFKSALSFRSEVDKMRVQKMGELWDVFARVHLQLEAALVTRARIVKEEFDQLGEDAKVNIVAARGIPDNAKNRIMAEIKPPLEQSLRRLEQAWPTLEAARFWLGERLYDMHVEHLKTLTQLSTELMNSMLSNDIAQVFESISTRRKASWTRLDIKQVEKAL